MDWSLGFDVCFYGFKQAYPGDSQPMGLTIKDEFEPSTNVYSELNCSLTLCSDIRHFDANACSLGVFDQCRSFGDCRKTRSLWILHASQLASLPASGLSWPHILQVSSVCIVCLVLPYSTCYDGQATITGRGLRLDMHIKWNGVSSCLPCREAVEK